jgi:hypothetical protein
LGSILVLYHSRQTPLRRAISDHLYAFRRHSGRPCIYINMAVRSVPAWIGELDIDLVILHTTVLSDRWQPDDFRDVVRRMLPVRGVRSPKIAMPQDEFLNTDILVEALEKIGVDHVFTCAPEEEWETIYGPLVAKGVGMTRVLTGYVEPDTVQEIDRLSHRVAAREIDIGYRAKRPRPWLGRHGMMKEWVANAFAAEGMRRGLRVDISNEPADTLLGDAWHRFLLSSRYTIGVESGASILDRGGRIRACSDAFLEANPGASFEDVERHCFAGLDGGLNLRAIAPRHFEACATRTPQILVEGAYNGILEAGRHYIPVRADFANLSEVVDEVVRGDHREMAEQAYAEIVASGTFGYPAFVSSVLATVPLGGARTRSLGMVGRGITAWERASDGPSWGWVWVRQRVRPLIRDMLGRVGLLPSIMKARSARRERRLRED